MKLLQSKYFWVLSTMILLIGYAVSCTKSDQVLDTPRPINSSTDLVSVKDSTPPVIDGIIDAIWENSPKLQFSTAVPENNVEAYVDSKGEIQKKMNNGHFAISVLGRYKIPDKTAIIAGYDQPLTEHLTNNPDPNISFGFEITTSSHAFQVFAGNYFGIVSQSNNVFNQNDYRKGQFLVGFNVTRLWNF